MSLYGANGCERGHLVIKYGTYTKAEDGAAASASDEEAETRRFLKGYTVFHASQIEGIEFPAPVALSELPLTTACDEARRIITGMPNPPAFKEGAAVPCYRPGSDRVNMPERGFFESEAAYYYTLFHELAHSTGHASRLARQVIEFAASIVAGKQPIYIQCTPLKGKPALECFPVVDEHVAKHGGKRELGWSVYTWPNVFIEAELHAIWLDGEGNRHDIAPHQFPMKQILFIPDPGASYGETYQVKNKRMALVDDPIVHKFIASAEGKYEEENRGELAKLKFFTPTPRWAKLNREMGECQMKLSLKYGLPPNTSALDKLMVKIARSL